MPREPLDHLIRRPWRDVTLPADATGIPTVLSKAEPRLLYGLAREYARDDAAIVDAGCFHGGSTAALLAGVRDRPRAWTGPFRNRFDANVGHFDVPHVVYEATSPGSAGTEGRSTSCSSTS
jgi:hypothetical protein